MTRENAIQDIKGFALELDLTFDEAALEMLYHNYAAAGFCDDQIEAEFGSMDTNQLIEAYISIGA